MNLPAYPRYKPSGVEWLGDVPEHWEVKRLKTSATYCVSNVDKVPAEDELPVRLCNYTDVYYNDYIVPELPFMETTATKSEIRRFGLKRNDVLITKDSEEWSDIAVPAMVKETAPDLVCGYHLAMISPSPQALRGEFLLRCFQSCAVNQQFQIAASGVTRYGLPKSSIGDAWVPLPSLTEQRAIADFLDERTGKLDALAEKKRGLIEKLNEKRSALIARTVTKGLPAEAAAPAGIPTHPKLKPSGIDWLGDIPEHWKVRRLKDHGTLSGGAGFPHEEQGQEGEDLFFYKVGDLRASSDGRIMGPSPHSVSRSTAKKLGASIIPPKSVIYAKIGAALLLNRRRITAAPCCIDNNMTAYTSDERTVSSAWAYQWLSILDFGEFVNPGAVPSYSEGDQGILPMPIPPLPEQTAIADYVDRETAKIDRMIEKVEAAIEKLAEYRTALITAAVTGKIDVRKAA